MTLGDDEARELSKMLEMNQKLKSLLLCSNHIGSAGASALAGALKQNGALNRL